jgi:hypothetical protein
LLNLRTRLLARGSAHAGLCQFLQELRRPSPNNATKEQAYRGFAHHAKRLLETRGGDMKYVTGFFVSAILLVLNVSDASSAVRITNDRGGLIERYVLKYQRLAFAGESVIIDGLCASACTIVLSEFPHDSICVTSRAALGFHAAWNYGPGGRTFTDPEATLMLYSAYPIPVRRWIARQGGLKRQIMFLSGKPLQAMYRSC